MKKLSALIIDDDEMLATFFATAFEDAGYDIHTVHDGLVALDYLKEQVPNVVVLDLQLPGVSGEKLLTFIKDDVRLKNTWVFATSIEGTRVAFLNEKADIILTKPVNYKQVLHLAVRVQSQLKES